MAIPIVFFASGFSIPGFFGALLLRFCWSYELASDAVLVLPGASSSRFARMFLIELLVIGMERHR